MPADNTHHLVAAARRRALGAWPTASVGGDHVPVGRPARPRSGAAAPAALPPSRPPSTPQCCCTATTAPGARRPDRAPTLSGTGRGMLVWTMSDAVLVATPSYFEAVMLKKVLDRQPGVRAVRAEKVASSPGAPPHK
jgi:hypothetical protein